MIWSADTDNCTLYPCTHPLRVFMIRDCGSVVFTCTDPVSADAADARAALAAALS